MKILYGTTNTAKLEFMRRATEQLPIEIVGLTDLGLPLPDIEENGNDPLENAIIKARVYYSTFNMPVFSCDSGLYFDGIEDYLQPKTHVRRIGNKELTDEEMIAYYSSLANKHGGSLTARYKNAICFIVSDGTEFTRFDESLSSEPFSLVSTPHPKRVKGFPLDAISVDIDSGKYYYDITEKYSDKLAVEKGLRGFFTDVLKNL